MVMHLFEAVAAQRVEKEALLIAIADRAAPMERACGQRIQLGQCGGVIAVFDIGHRVPGC